MKSARFFSPFKRQRGFSLVELMVALVLGLVVIGGVIGVFLSNREVYRQNENLSRMQESARYAFELMARSVREAGGIACDSGLPMANVLNNMGSTWWSTWNEQAGFMKGFEGADGTFPKPFGSGAADRVSGTDAVIILSGTLIEGISVLHYTQVIPDIKGQFRVTTADHDIDLGDILLICSYKHNFMQWHAAIFQATSVGGDIIEYDKTDASVTPGNCSISPACFPPVSSFDLEGLGYLTKLTAHAWYIGHNGRGGRSLYRLKLQNNSGTAGDTAEEIAEGVRDLQIQYLTRNASGDLATDYVNASSVADWTKVVAVRLTFILESLENVAVGASPSPLTRTWNTVVTLRNRAL